MGLIIQLKPDGRQSETAAAIQKGVCRHFRAQGFATLCEYTLASGRRADVLALGVKPAVIPLGIDYERPELPGTGVDIEVGPPVSLDDRIAQRGVDGRPVRADEQHSVEVQIDHERPQGRGVEDLVVHALVGDPAAPASAEGPSAPSRLATSARADRA